LLPVSPFFIARTVVLSDEYIQCPGTGIAIKVTVSLPGYKDIAIDIGAYTSALIITR